MFSCTNEKTRCCTNRKQQQLWSKLFVKLLQQWDCLTVYHCLAWYCMVLHGTNEKTAAAFCNCYNNGPVWGMQLAKQPKKPPYWRKSPQTSFDKGKLFSVPNPLDTYFFHQDFKTFLWFHFNFGSTLHSKVNTHSCGIYVGMNSKCVWTKNMTENKQLSLCHINPFPFSRLSQYARLMH